jgi:hypothetical protein
MSAIDVFLPYVRPFAPGVSDPTAYRAIRNSVVEFCERTRLWKYESTTTITASAAQAIATPSGSILHDIEAVSFNGHPLRPVTPSDLDWLSPNWRTEAEGGLPQYVTQIDQNTLRIVPRLDGELYLCLRLKPSKDTNVIPDFIANEYSECIGWGALGRLLMVPGQQYTNPDMAVAYTARFGQKLDTLANKGIKGQQNAPKRTRASFF